MAATAMRRAPPTARAAAAGRRCRRARPTLERWRATSFWAPWSTSPWSMRPPFLAPCRSTTARWDPRHMTSSAAFRLPTSTTGAHCTKFLDRDCGCSPLSSSRCLHAGHLCHSATSVAVAAVDASRQQQNCPPRRSALVTLMSTTEDPALCAAACRTRPATAACRR